MNAFNLNKIPQEVMYKKGYDCIGLSPERIIETLGLGLKAQNNTEINVILLELIYFFLEHKEIIGKDDLPEVGRIITQYLIESSTTGENVDKSNFCM